MDARPTRATEFGASKTEPKLPSCGSFGLLVNARNISRFSFLRPGKNLACFNVEVGIILMIECLYHAQTVAKTSVVIITPHHDHGFLLSFKYPCLSFST